MTLAAFRTYDLACSCDAEALRSSFVRLHFILFYFPFWHYSLTKKALDGLGYRPVLSVIAL